MSKQNKERDAATCTSGVSWHVMSTDAGVRARVSDGISIMYIYMIVPTISNKMPSFTSGRSIPSTVYPIK
jgi:hypothetical protein